jgi:threonine/homoserine/homoserine lactone efflux protein
VLELLATILPLAIASTMSPGILAITIALLSGKNHQKIRTIAYNLGGLLTALIILYFTIFSGRVGLGNPTEPGGIDYLDTAIGIVFILFAIRTWTTRNNREKKLEEKTAKPNFGKWFFIGFITTITNFDAVLFYFTEIHEIVDPGTTFIYSLILMLIATFFFLSPSLVPLIMYLVDPKKASERLKPASEFMKKYGSVLVAAIFFIFGVVLLMRGMGWHW